MSSYRKLEDLVVFQRLCQSHIGVCALTHQWPAEEKYELGSQARRSSKSSPAQLAGKCDDRHVRNKLESVNLSRGEAAETIHHLYKAHPKGHESKEAYEHFLERYQECIRMLNGMERLETSLPERDRRWPEKPEDPESKIQEASAEYCAEAPPGYPDPTISPCPLNPEP